MLLKTAILLNILLIVAVTGELDCPVNDDSLIIDTLNGKIKGSCSIINIDSKEKKVN
jgi:hypothetical protein